MGIEAIITLIVILVAVVLFATEYLTVDTVALLIMVALVLTGVISPVEAAQGFSNSATLTVLFMFILSGALLKTGALQHLAIHISSGFKGRYMLSMAALMLFVGAVSAMVNNTPVVAVFIPVILQIARRSGIPATKMLIPLSFASIFGGMCTLIGTSTNILVSGIVENHGLPAIGMFDMLPVGAVLLVVGVLYMLVIGFRLLPDREEGSGLTDSFNESAYLTDIELLSTSTDVGKTIMGSELVNELRLDVVELRRGGASINMPPGDLTLQAGDTLRVRCDIERIRSMKEQMRIQVTPSVRIGGNDLTERGSSLVELVIPSGSVFEGKTLRDVDFRRSYRAIPLAIRHRKEVHQEHLYDVPMRAGDVILAEIKTHFIRQINKLERGGQSPFIMLSQDSLIDFNKKQFGLVLGIMLLMIVLATLGIMPILIGAMTAVAVLVVSRTITMKEAYASVSWNIIFLLAGALSLGQAMGNSGLDAIIADSLIGGLGAFGPVVVVSGLYLVTSLLTELMSNNAAAALVAPIAIATAASLGLNPTPFIMAVTFAASASFLTPIGYQTNAMVYGAGNYRFSDFARVGIGLNLIFWLITSILIPIIFPF